ncbi:bifunctional demethylmenaquinone methyltransferase/2-methoxy-6-polyprenyl-1,4-benzoquinol methylase UbiE [Campylobacter sp. MG1]|uniref:bifunctional demethylmenaquinone methyltransferase/2-methoxy-6-polyprenyl-1,4-benzoquinol methylase UbiE n=1 Tax=Campylobacter sp. MG1 TaxID=2976332 RepID=UPI00226D3384|nr:bifunctional demethylmenaquinone methyltransferase/2-methoxy-6-polyprenyl-1,4-benzoquinol methylase UbiE [Campylobacter sp. MG1]
MQKQEKIVQMFNEIAPSYDKANKILSFGIDSQWRKFSVDKIKEYLNFNNELKVVDVACGTGDMCYLLKEISNAKVIGVDPSVGMLDIAKKRFNDVEFKVGYANKLPFEDCSIDLITISYGFRNVVEKDEALKEFYRVLKPNANLLILEFFRRENNGFIAKCRDFYLKKILPIIGGILSKNKAAYEYLPNSIDEFYSNDEFKHKLNEKSFKLEFFKSFSYGVCSLFIARKV